MNTVLRKSLAVTILLGFFGTSCGSVDRSPKPDSEFDDALLPYFFSFVVDAARYGRDLSGGDDTIVLRFGQLRDGVAGRCDSLAYRGPKGFLERTSPPDDTWKEITISRAVPTTDGRFKSLVYHELSHCLLGLTHDEDDETAIMYPSLPRFPMEAEENWADAVRQLMESAADGSTSAASWEATKSDPSNASSNFSCGSVVPR